MQPKWRYQMDSFGTSTGGRVLLVASTKHNTQEENIFVKTEMVKTPKSKICNFTCNFPKGKLQVLQPNRIEFDAIKCSIICLCFGQYSLCNEPLIELTNPGASGSIFYVTRDDEFIIKTVLHKEAEFLQKLLPGYYMVRPLSSLLFCVMFSRTISVFIFGPKKKKLILNYKPDKDISPRT